MLNLRFIKRLFWAALVSLLILPIQTPAAQTIKAPTNAPANFSGGVWQTIVDGQKGEGALFYRLIFGNDGNVEIIKQCGGSDNIVEQKKWFQSNNNIVIESREGDIIREFDGNTLQILDTENLTYKSGTYVSIVKPYKPTPAFIHWILILVVLIALNEIFRRNKWSVLIFFVLLPIILTPFVWAEQGVTHWFKCVKDYSVVFAVIWFTIIRFTELGKLNWVKLVAALILGINIMEAVSQDFSMGYWPNIMNGIAGVLNTITLFYGWKKIAPDNSKEKDMIWPGMTIFWIVAYDIWNITYVYLNFPGSTSAQLMVIAACTIPALFIKKGTWLQARGFTLAAWFMYYFTFPRFTEQMELLVPRNYVLMFGVAALSMVLNIIYLFVFIKMLQRDRKLLATKSE